RVPVERLEHEAVTAQRHQDVGVLRAVVAVRAHQGRAGRARPGGRAGQEADPRILGGQGGRTGHAPRITRTDEGDGEPANGTGGDQLIPARPVPREGGTAATRRRLSCPPRPPAPGGAPPPRRSGSRAPSASTGPPASPVRTAGSGRRAAASSPPCPAPACARHRPAPGRPPPSAVRPARRGASHGPGHASARPPATG